MAKDYARKQKSTSSRTKKGNQSTKKSNKQWILLGFILGLVIGAGWYFIRYNYPAIKKAVNQRAYQKKEFKKTAKKKKPAFDFYTLLPNMKVHPQSKKELKTSSQKKLSNKAQHYQYIVQVASLSTVAEADRIKAALILEGYPVKTREFNNRKKIWHRVIVGPYTRRQQAEKAQQTLAKLHYKGLLVRE